MEGKNKMMMIIIIVLLVVLIGAVVGLALFSMQAMKGSAEQESGGPAVEKIVQLTHDQMTQFKLETAIVTNLRTGTDGIEHQIRIGLSFDINNVEKDSESFITMLKDKETVVRAMAIEVIYTKTYQELSRPDGQEILKNDILVKLQEEFNTNLIVAVYIYEILLI